MDEARKKMDEIEKRVCEALGIPSIEFVIRLMEDLQEVKNGFTLLENLVKSPQGDLNCSPNVQFPAPVFPTFDEITELYRTRAISKEEYETLKMKLATVER